MKNHLQNIVTLAPVLFMVLIVLPGCKTPQEFNDGHEALHAVRQRISDVTAIERGGSSKAILVGTFIYPGPELIRQTGPSLFEHKLELLDDETYRYKFSADVVPEQILDKGRWKWNGLLIVLESDKSLPERAFPENRIYLPFHYKRDGQKSLLLMGLERDFPRFKNATPNEFHLYLHTFEKEHPSG
jgi:hypothetical protein